MKRILGIIVMAAMLIANGSAFATDKEVVIWKDGKLNANGATKELLLKVGVEGDLADALLEARKEAGEFVDIEELMDVEGVDAPKLRELKKILYVEPIPDCGC